MRHCATIFNFFQVITQSQALNVLKNKKGRTKKHDKNITTGSGDHMGLGASALASDASDGTDEAIVVARESCVAECARLQAAAAGV